ncbi:outer membrane protein assembly factor BamA [Aquimonas voraii]|uniref:Outer membrane protein assembly factor BamA n=1 Tax=Aquimonas voraii TaxID=265719 RepID=A0A1G6S5I6_9GAMM|nr:outer membrane protein assembly factor BamA [Aquimonas voraii]SDD11924.1 Beta-barrel assembly machine subunit BamA [Aquimonas voraii]
MSNRYTALPLLAFMIAAPVQAQSFEPFVITDIRIDGLQRISAGTVFTYLPLELGDRVGRGEAADAIRALFRTGFFSDVRLDRQGNGILVVTVTERPAINTITLSGNKDIKTEELMKGLSGIGLSEGETFNQLQLDKVTQELTRQYNNRGKYNVSISPTVSQLDRNRVDIKIDVKEGRAAKIKHLNLVGNKTFSTEEILDEWESGTTNWLSWYRQDDQYSREKLSGDLEKLTSFYLDRGYVDFNIESSQVSISPDRRDMYITASVTEGEVYTVDDVKVSGDTIIPVEDMEKLVFIAEGQTFSRRLLEFTSDAMTNTLSNIGYAFASVNPVPTIDRENRKVSINFVVDPGKRVNVRRIVFKGNTRTSDEVLRREMRQFEGMWFSQAAIDRSKIRLQRLGFFDDVTIDTPQVPGTDDQVDIEISVTERTSGSFQFGLGYSQFSGLITTVAVQQNNFFGTGNQIGVTVQNNSFVKRMDFSYFDPYFTEDGVSVGYNMSYRELDQVDANLANFRSDSGSFRAIFGLPITETDTVGLSFGIDRNTIFPSEGFTPQSIIDYINALERRTFNSWRTELSWSRNSTNAFFNPTRGTFQRVAAEVTLPGSTVEYYKLSYEFNRYWPLSRHLVLLTRADIGYGDSYGDRKERLLDVVDGQGNTSQRLIVADGLPFFENFYAGGERSIRGFETNTLGPVGFGTLAPTTRQPLGGSLKTVGSLEFIFPTLLDSNSARVSAFVDFGNVFAGTENFSSSDVRASAGIALQWQAPIGPIVISWAQPLKYDREIDRVEKLQFTFGTLF